MKRSLNGLLISLTVFGVVVVVIIYLLAGIFNWNTNFPSLKTMLDIGACAVALAWLLFILKVPWDLYFETNNVLFEMQRSRERDIPVNEDRRLYVLRMRWITATIAVSAHIISAGIIAGLTYWSKGQVGYYFAFFYLLTTCFRPAAQGYRYLLVKLHEIRGEVIMPREDAAQLRTQFQIAIERLTALEVRLNEYGKRLVAGEEKDHNLRAELRNLASALERAEQLNENRIQLLTGEIERTLSKAFDQQDVVNGLRAFARLIKQA